MKVKCYAEFLPMVNIVGTPECDRNTPEVFSLGLTKALCEGFQICRIIRITWEALERRFQDLTPIVDQSIGPEENFTTCIFQ